MTTRRQGRRRQLISTTQERRHKLLKKDGLPALYWDLILNDRA